MIFLAFVLSVSLIAVSAGLNWSLRKNIEYMDRLEEVQELIQNAIRVLDDQYQKIDQKSKMEVFSDEPIVRELIQDILVSKASVEECSKALSQVVKVDEENEDSVE